MKPAIPLSLAALTLASCESPLRPVAPQRSTASWAADAASGYTVQDLGTIGGSYTSAFRINATGQVVGQATTATGDLHGFRWTESGGMQDLGTLPGSTLSIAFGINDQGIVVGESDLSSGPRAVLWTPSGKIRDLGTLGGPVAFALGINNRGEVVGGSTLASGGPMHGFIWTAQGGMKDVGTLNGTNTRLRTINRAGTAGAGSGNVGFGHAHAVVWHPATGFQDLGTLGGADVSLAWRINDSEQVVGFSFTPIAQHGFLWTQATGMVDLGAFNGPPGASEATDVNDRGQVVGGSTTQADPANFHAFLRNEAGDMRQLIDFVGEIASEAEGINEAGVIVGSADTPDGRTHALLWTPVKLRE